MHDAQQLQSKTVKKFLNKLNRLSMLEKIILTACLNDHLSMMHERCRLSTRTIEWHLINIIKKLENIK